MDPTYTYPGVYQPQQLWSPDYPLAQNYYSYPRVTHGAGVEVTRAARGCNSQSDEEGESEVSWSVVMMGWVVENVGQVTGYLAVSTITGRYAVESECAHGWEECWYKYMQCCVHTLCTYQCQAPPTTPRGYVETGWGLDTFGSRLPHTSGRATSQILDEYCVMQAIRVAY